MEISGVYGNSQAMNLPMSEEQKSALEEIMAKYDPENMTPEDMQAIRQEMRDAGIPKSAGAMSMLREAGFGPKDGERPPAGMAGMGSENQKGELWDLYKQFQSGEITEAEFLAQVKNQGTAGSLINYIS